ncbi:MAG: cupin domain-containing protein [Candidatus Amulumruptor caecigallinarius]|nr:cupin domain-containing protein [Candidatus Amulumruptor caecigallinarius]
MDTKFETKEQFHLQDALNYVRGEVEFRTIMSSHNGSVDLVAISKDSELREHAAPEDVLVYVIEGEVDFHISESVQRLNAGDSLLLEKGTLHSVRPFKDSKIMLVKIRP